VLENYRTLYSWSCSWSSVHSAAVASSGLNVQFARRVFRFQAERRLYRLRTNMGLVLVLKYLLRAVTYLKLPTILVQRRIHACNRV